VAARRALRQQREFLKAVEVAKACSGLILSRIVAPLISGLLYGVRPPDHDYRDFEFRKSVTTMSIATIDPATGKTVRTFEAFSAARVNESLNRAVAAYQQHRADDQKRKRNSAS
jgi:hypothetical protein